jgi:hypothetical protein
MPAFTVEKHLKGAVLKEKIAEITCTTCMSLYGFVYLQLRNISREIIASFSYVI